MAGESAADSVRSVLIHVARRLPAGFVQWLGRAQFASPRAGRVLKAASRPLLNADTTIPRGPARGLRFNPAGTNPGYALGTSEPAIQEALSASLHEGAVLYDIGANVGFFTLLGARRVGRAGRVVAFEPLPSNVAALRHNVALNGFENVTVVAKAVMAASGVGDLELADITTQGRVRVREGAVRGPAVEVATTSIDDELERGSFEPPSLVKLDVEGAELEALRGMRRTIERYRPVILCELHGTNRAFAEMMRELAYDVTVLEGFATVEEAPWWIHALARPQAAA